MVNMGVGSAVTEKKHIDDAVAALAQITGQKPLVTNAARPSPTSACAKDMPIGGKVTLRGLRMYEFLDRLISLALPRVRDFRGLSPDGFDGHGNYSLGLSDSWCFRSSIPTSSCVPRHELTFVTEHDSNDESRELLRGFGMPFKRRIPRPAKAGPRGIDHYRIGSTG